MTSPNDFAPYPKTEDEVTAKVLADAITVDAHGRQELLNEYMQDNSPKGKRLYATSVEMFLNEYGVVFLLRELADVDPARADKAAKRLFSDWADGASVVEWLWEWVRECGFNPDEVSRVAEKQARESVAKLKDVA